MPRAGWCRECGSWVWVGEDGECQFGHDASCVESVHEQPDPTEHENLPPASESRFGRGELPDELRRFNWGAFFVPFFWGLSYRSWPVLTAWFIAITSPLLIVGITGPLDGVRLSTLLGATLVAEIVSGICRIWAGLNANQLLWRRDSVLRDLVPTYSPKYTVDSFIARQRVWTIAGAIVTGVGSVALMPFEAAVWREYGLTYVGAAMPLVWLVAEVLLGLWLDTRLRKEPPDLEESAHDLV